MWCPIRVLVFGTNNHRSVRCSSPRRILKMTIREHIPMEIASYINKIHDSRYAKFMPAGAFVAGLTWDSVTMTRIDRLLDNLILFAYILASGLLIIIVSFIDKDLIKNELLLKYRKWYNYALQFFFGGLFSGYAVYYFQSSSFTKASVFFIFIAIFLIINEFIEKKYTNHYLQISLFFLVNFTFYIFFIPVLLNYMGVSTFILAGVISLIITESIVFLFQKREIYGHYRELFGSRVIPVALFLIISLFYYMNWIPPVPLSLKFSGVYHNVVRSASEDGSPQYELSMTKPSWYQSWKSSDNVIYTGSGGSVYCFTAVFASAKLKTEIYHRWQKFSEEKDEWQTSDEIRCDITGGREEGYRGLSYKGKSIPGQWRVNVETKNGLLLGRIEFEISNAKVDNLEFKQILK